MNRLRLLYRIFKSFVIFLISIFAAISISSCVGDEGVVSAPVQQYGIGGRIVDTSGTPLSNVQIYCLFNYYYPPYYVSSISSLNKPAGVNTFGFELKQNFPNPVRNSTYIRFSLPSAFKVTISIVEKSTGIEKYNYSNDFDYGLYQYPLLNFVTDHQLTNGHYDIFLKAAQNGKIKYQANRTMFVISDSGKPNLISSNSGYYLFNYNDACIGDTLIWADNEYQDDTTRVFNYVNLLFRKDGYYSEIKQFVMYPNLLYNQDIIMTKKEN
jgi:hypothetical protein